MTINKFTLDASVLIPLISKNDVYSHPSGKFFKKVFGKNTKFIIPMVSLFETFHVLKRNGFLDGDNEMREFEDFFNFECFEFIDLDFRFFDLFKMINFFRNLKTSDAIIATTAISLSSPLITWDKKIVSNTLNAYTPTDFLNRFSD